jgi:ferredoxin-NADP reductase
MTAASELGSSWNGPTGLIDGSLIKTATAGLPAPIYYVAGPPGLVEAMRQTLNDAGITDDDIRSEDFYGY